MTERGRPVAVAVSVERWNQLQERIEDLEDAVAIRARIIASSRRSSRCRQIRTLRARES